MKKFHPALRIYAVCLLLFLSVMVYCMDQGILIFGETPHNKENNTEGRRRRIIRHHPSYYNHK